MNKIEKVLKHINELILYEYYITIIKSHKEIKIILSFKREDLVHALALRKLVDIHYFKNVSNKKIIERLFDKKIQEKVISKIQRSPFYIDNENRYDCILELSEILNDVSFNTFKFLRKDASHLTTLIDFDYLFQKEVNGKFNNYFFIEDDKSNKLILISNFKRENDIYSRGHISYNVKDITKTLK